MSRSGGGKGERQSHRDIESHRTGPKVLVEVVLLRTREVVLPELLVVRERERERSVPGCDVDTDSKWYRPDLSA